MNTTERIRQQAEQLQAGQPVTIQTFMMFGNRAAVDQSLGRLVKEGVLSRPARGVYVRPRKNPYVGEVPPEPLEVAEAIAKETGAVIQVQGAEAARRMGFSTQVPTHPIFHTSGPSRRLYLGQMEITLKHTSPRKLALTGRPAGIALTALWYLGKNSVTVETIERIHTQLASEEFEALRSAAPSMPAWMHDAFIKYEMGLQHA